MKFNDIMVGKYFCTDSGIMYYRDVSMVWVLAYTYGSWRPHIASLKDFHKANLNWHLVTEVSTRCPAQKTITARRWGSRHEF